MRVASLELTDIFARARFLVEFLSVRRNSRVHIVKRDDCKKYLKTDLNLLTSFERMRICQRKKKLKKDMPKVISAVWLLFVHEKNTREVCIICSHWGSRDGAAARALASHHCVSGSFSGFFFSSKTIISKFQFDLDYCPART